MPWVAWGELVEGGRSVGNRNLSSIIFPYYRYLPYTALVLTNHHFARSLRYRHCTGVAKSECLHLLHSLHPTSRAFKLLTNSLANEIESGGGYGEG